MATPRKPPTLSSITIDDREPAQIRLQLHSQAPRGLVINTERLDFGDFRFVGNGPDGTHFPILVERKTISDFINSSFTGRLASHQLPGLCRSSPRPYLLLEGRFRFNDASKALEVRNSSGGDYWVPLNRGRTVVTADTLYGLLNSITTQTPIQLIYSPSIHDTPRAILALARWWRRPWTSHKSLSQLRAVPPPSTGAFVPLTAPSLMFNVAAALPGIGPTRAASVETAFPSVEALARSTVADWVAIEGIGRTTARRVVNAIRNGGSN